MIMITEKNDWRELVRLPTYPQIDRAEGQGLDPTRVPPTVKKGKKEGYENMVYTSHTLEM
jgi:hypothetical protein